MYRQLFVGDAAKYVLADLRDFAHAKEQQTDILDLMTKSREELVIQATRVAMYRRILLMLEITDEEIDIYERQVRERMAQGEQPYG